jgi:hypothetical protein
MIHEAYLLLFCFFVLEVVVIVFCFIDKDTYPELSLRVLIYYNQSLPFGVTIFIWVLMQITGFRNG